jgi:hypothetical protein
MAEGHASKPDETPEVLTKTDARQGETKHMTRYVLTYGVTGVVILFVLVYLLFFMR